MTEHAAAVLRLLRGMAGGAADDCFQETFLAALRAYPDFDGRNGRAWIATIARRKALDHLRRANRDRPVEPAALAEATPAETAAGPADHELARAIRGLADGQRDAILLRYAADMSFRQIGEELDCTESAARRRVHDGLAHLRRRYKKEMAA